MHHKASFSAQTASTGLKICGNTVVKADASQRKPLVLMQLVLKLASPSVARKRESKRARQGELMVLPVATPAAPRRLRRVSSLFTVETCRIVKEMVEKSDQIT